MSTKRPPAELLRAAIDSVRPTPDRDRTQLGRRDDGGGAFDRCPADEFIDAVAWACADIRDHEWMPIGKCDDVSDDVPMQAAEYGRHRRMRAHASSDL